MDYKLTANKRDTSIKLAELRKRDGAKKAQIPGVVYGPKHESTPITVDYSEFLKLFRQAGTSHVIELDIDKKKVEVLVQEAQLDPVSDEFIHLDFYAIVAGEKISTKVPFVFVGESPAEKIGLMIEHNLHEAEITCLPKDLVGEINVDISKLVDDGDIIHLSDVDIDRSKIEFTIPEETAVASAHKLRAHKVEDETTSVAVEGEGEEGSEEGAEAAEGGEE